MLFGKLIETTINHLSLVSFGPGTKHVSTEHWKLDHSEAPSSTFSREVGFNLETLI